MTAVSTAKPGLGFVPFVCMIAAMMALGAMGIDSMLPNLPKIAHALGVSDENRQQLIVTAYMLGFGGAQIIYGSLSDRFGRRPVLLGGLGVYVAFSLIAALSRSFELLLAARLVQGIGAATTRVLPVSIVRDRYEGRDMARVMSLSAMVFMAAPVLAPMVGQTIALVASWRWVFATLGLAGAGVMTWAALSLPETLRPENRIPISPARIGGAFKAVLTTREAMGYCVAQALVFGGLLGFINSAQQIFADALHAVNWFPITFAITASFLAMASLLNARLVVRVGMRALSHAALLGFIAVGAVHCAIALSGHETLVGFAALQALAMFTYGLTAGNFSAMAMEKMGHMAGAASSLQGFIIMVGASLIGFFIGQAFNGTVVPVELGYLACGVLSLAAVLFAEGGRLFRAQHLAPAATT
jgi:DHA1 family bicyclomycin/chloramphenicol resistance-like MFS transporter